MNENEDYFRISKNGNVHTLSDRIPFRWKELMIWTSTSFLFLIYLLGLWAGILVAILTLMGYMFYRFAASIYYSVLEINEQSGRMTRTMKFLDRIHKEELITDKFDPSRFEFSELSRSGKSKFLMNYRTHKNNELLVLKNKTDKEFIQKYISENFDIGRNV